MAGVSKFLKSKVDMPVTLYISVSVGVDPVIIPYCFISKYFSKDWRNHNAYRV